MFRRFYLVGWNVTNKSCLFNAKFFEFEEFSIVPFTYSSIQPQHAVGSVHKHQISPSETVWKCLGVLLTETFYCLRLYSIFFKRFTALHICLGIKIPWLILSENNAQFTKFPSRSEKYVLKFPNRSEKHVLWWIEWKCSIRNYFNILHSLPLV